MRIRKGSILISTIMIMTTIVVSVSLITASITLKRRFVNLDSFRVQKDLDQRSIQVLLCSYTKCVVDEQWRHMADTCYERVGSMQNSSEEDVINDMEYRFYNSTYYTKGMFDTKDWKEALHLSRLYVELYKVKKVEYVDSAGDSKNVMCFLYRGNGRRLESTFYFFGMVNVECPDIKLEKDKSVSKQVDWDSFIKNGGVNFIKKE
ncbi:hypothetical protein HMPREF0389_00321 [Filifactor alocis ATCC 35896]|uniref:Uncharacterized protein n=2 Tax=Filifactor TaxID=44259 RepID=D6GRW5_FILAD|nr:hypothetical protein [Filifactor alocis]EFE28406.1 hypothetical protein HMPREF0389_00321 [Filifactor alocis ATCC 35896]